MSERYLLDDLETADMLEIDGLHASEFSLDEALLDEADAAAEAGEPFGSSAMVLQIQALDGSQKQQWAFSYNALMEAEYLGEDKGWRVDDEHSIRCFSAVAAEGDDE